MIFGQVDRSVVQAKAVLEASLTGDTSQASPVKAEGFSVEAGSGSSSSPAAVNGKRRYCFSMLISVDACSCTLVFSARALRIPYAYIYMFSSFCFLNPCFIAGPCSFWAHVCSGPFDSGAIIVLSHVCFDWFIFFFF